MRTAIPLAFALVTTLTVGPLAAALDLSDTDEGTVPVAPRATDLPSDARFEPGLMDAAVAVGGLDVLVRFHAAVPPLPADLVVHYRFQSVPAVYATATPAALDALRTLDALAYAEQAKALAPALASATRASLARDVFDPSYNASTPPVYDQDGAVVDGRGVAIAVVDTGLDATHPAFAAPGKVAGNWLVTPGGVTGGGDFTAQDAHGTHVAGIAAGTGAGSFQNVEKGSAPGATLHGFAVGGSMAFAAVAFDWILKHGAAQDPPIRVVLNAWTCATTVCRVWDAQQLHNVLASDLAQAGFVVVHAVGNDGGSGFAATTSPAATNPTPGVIGVADYADQDSGLRVACLYPTSSRGAANDPLTWPDIAAPGRDTTSPHAIETSAATRLPGVDTNVYTRFHGTSAAAAHAAGIAALLLQARPDLTAADVEYLLKRTATPLDCGRAYVHADAAHPWTPANYAAGHGLVHAYDAVVAAQGFTSIPTEHPPLEPLPEAWRWLRTGADITTTHYVKGEGVLTASYPEGSDPAVRIITTDQPFAVRSAAFTTEATYSATTVDLWVGTDWESTGPRFTQPRLRVVVQHVHADGNVSMLATGLERGWFVPTLAPVHRPFLIPFDTPVTFAPGDRLSLRVEVTGTPVVGGVVPVPPAALLYSGAWQTPSRIGLGTVAPTDPGTVAHCLARHDCADVGDTKRIEGVDCATAPWRLEWTGPPGSFIALSCHGSVHTCTVPGMPGDAWATCARTAAVETLPSNNKASTCSYWTPDGARVPGWGRCLALFPVEDED